MRVAIPSGWQMLSGTGDALTGWSSGWAGAWDSRQPPGWGKHLDSLLHMSPDRDVVQPRSIATVAAWLLQHTMRQNSLPGTSLSLPGQEACFADSLQLGCKGDKRS